MPLLPGEERVLTVFADIHYYFSAPTPKPHLHRFDKGSYLYIYHNAVQQKTRIEVANNPGTPDQDAFNGALDQVHLRHSTKFPTLCTLTVDGWQNSQGYPPPPSNPYEWHLPTSDPGNPAPVRLHTLDIYLWTLDDSNQFLDLLERQLASGQVETDRHPFPPPAQQGISTVVQQLENVAIADPAYQNGQTRNSQSEATTTARTSISTPSALPPPPPSAPPSGTQQQQDPAPQNAAPLPYNPAAPAAPEPIQHREKTPPPPMDGTEGTGLAAAATSDNIAPPLVHNGMTPSAFAPQPQTIPYSMPGSYASPPPSAGLPPHSAGLGGFPSSIHSPPPPPPSSTVPSYNPSFLAGSSAGPPTQGTPPASMTFAPPPKDPNAHLYGSDSSRSSSIHQPTSYTPQPHQQQVPQHQQQQSIYAHQPSSPPPPIGGYSNYSYDNTATTKALHGGIGDYEMHSQLYRPTEAEANSHHQKYAQMAVQNPGQRPRGLEERAHRVENKVNSFLRRLDKKM